MSTITDLRTQIDQLLVELSNMPHPEQPVIIGYQDSGPYCAPCFWRMHEFQYVSGYVYGWSKNGWPLGAVGAFDDIDPPTIVTTEATAGYHCDECGELLTAEENGTL